MLVKQTAKSASNLKKKIILIITIIIIIIIITIKGRRGGKDVD